MKKYLLVFCSGFLISLFLATPMQVLATSEASRVVARFSTLNETISPTPVVKLRTVCVPEHLVARQSGSLSDINTFGVMPQHGDTLDAGHFTVTIDQSFTAGQLTSPAGQVALIGEFVVETGVTLTVNGDWDASLEHSQNILKAGARIEFDGAAGVNRRYKTITKHYTEPSLVIQSTAQNKAFFGLKPGSAATFSYDKQKYYGANISGGNVHLNGFSTGYEHDGYDRIATRDCNMPDVLVTNSELFKLRYSAGDNGTCDMKNLTILSPTGPVAFQTVGTASSTTQGENYNLNGLSVDGQVAFYTRPEFMMNDWVVRDLAATLPQAGWQNVDSWLLFDTDTIPVGSSLTSNIYFRGEKYNPHGFTMSGGEMSDGKMSNLSSRTIDSTIFDFNNLAAGESGDLYLFSGPAASGETVVISNNIGLKNLNGQQSSTFITFNDDEQGGRQLVLENNVVFIPPDNRVISLNEASLTPSNSLKSIKNNIFWGDMSYPGYVVESLGNNSHSDIISAGAYSNNRVFNARTDGEYSELDLPLSYRPNSDSITAFPNFYDDQRRLDSYGAQVLGLDGTAESAFNAHLTRHLSSKDINQLDLMARHQAYVTNHQGVLLIKELIDWVKQGFIATTTSYHTTSMTTGPIGLAVAPSFTMADSDGDAIDDQFDLCSNTAMGSTVDSHGCADHQKDDDNDKVTNDTDICISTVANATVNVQGCSAADIKGQIAGFKSWGIGGGGAMAGYSINPFDDKMRFVGTDMGTSYRSLNSGVNWAPIRHEQATFSNRLGYAASFGFAGPTTILHAPQGFNSVLSVDGGETFHAPASFALVYSDDGDNSNDERVSSWYSDTRTVGTVYALSNLGLWRSVDAGNHWRFVYAGGDIKGMFIDNHHAGMVYIATENEILHSADGVTYANYFTPKGHKIHRFTGGSTPSGKTLTYASDESRLAIETSKLAGLASGDVMALYTKPSGAGDEVSAGMIYVDNTGLGFLQTNQFVGSHLSMAQNDNQTIYATGSRSWGRDKGTSIYVSEDAGANWQLRLLQYNWDTSPFTPWDSVLLEHSPVGLNVGWYDGGYYSTAVNQLNSAQFGGSGNFFLHATENTGQQWLDLTNEYQSSTPASPVKTDEWLSAGLNVTSVYDIKFHPANSNDIYAAYADIHGARSSDHGNTWQILPSSENSIYDYAFDPADANIVYMANGNQHDWPFRSLSLVGRGGVFKSTDKGDNWTRLTPNDSAFNRQYMSIGYDATRNDIYAGSHSDGISRSLDGGVSWEKFNAGLPDNYPGHRYAMDLVIPQIEVLDNGNVYALVTGFRPKLTEAEYTELAIPPSELMPKSFDDTTEYYSWINAAFTGIYLLDVVNGATRWQLLRGNIDLDSHGYWDPTHLPWKRPMSFAIDPNNPDILWLTDIELRTSQTGASGVWKSVDKGQNWTFVHQHTVALDIDIDPNDSNYVIVAGPKSWGNGGIYVSKNAGTSWALDDRAPLQNNAYSVSFDPQHQDKIIYGYFGGGMLYGDQL